MADEARVERWAEEVAKDARSPVERCSLQSAERREGEGGEVADVGGERKCAADGNAFERQRRQLEKGLHRERAKGLA